MELNNPFSYRFFLLIFSTPLCVRQRWSLPVSFTCFLALYSNVPWNPCARSVGSPCFHFALLNDVWSFLLLGARLLACAASANCLFPSSAFGFCMFKYYYNFLPRVLCSTTSLFSSFLLEMFAPLLVFTQVEHVRWFGHIETCYCVLDLWNFACCYRKMQLTCGSRLSLFFLVLWKYGGKRRRVLHRALQVMAYVYLWFLSPWDPNFA